MPREYYTLDLSLSNLARVPPARSAVAAPSIENRPSESRSISPALAPAGSMSLFRAEISRVDRLSNTACSLFRPSKRSITQNSGGTVFSPGEAARGLFILVNADYAAVGIHYYTAV